VPTTTAEFRARNNRNNAMQKEPTRARQKAAVFCSALTADASRRSRVFYSCTRISKANWQFPAFYADHLKNNNQVVKRPLGRPKNFTLPIPTPKPEDKPKDKRRKTKSQIFLYH
jgi:hypothetical protein